MAEVILYVGSGSTGTVEIEVAEGAVIERAMTYFSAQIAGKDMVWWIWRNVK